MNEEPAGNSVAGFRILRKFERGTLGRVYKAHQDSPEREVALRLLPPGFASGDRAFLDRFRRESHSALQLFHPNIGSVFAVDEANGRYFIAVEFVAGADLLSILLKRGHLPVRQALSIARQIAKALGAAHALGIVHGGIKPNNVMLDPHSRVKVVDFGLAPLRGERGMRHLGLGASSGSPVYRSPEQWRGQEADARSDIFSLGVTTYQLLAGRLPFQATSQNGMADAVARQPHRLLADYNRDVPEPVVALIDRMLEKNPDRRLDMAEKVVAEIDRFTGGPHADDGGSINHPAPLPQNILPLRPAPEVPANRKRHLVLMSAAALAATMGVAILLLRKPAEPQPQFADAIPESKQVAALGAPLPGSPGLAGAMKTLKKLPSELVIPSSGLESSLPDESDLEASSGSGTSSDPLDESAANSNDASESKIDVNTALKALPKVSAANSRASASAPAPKRKRTSGTDATPKPGAAPPTASNSPPTERSDQPSGPESPLNAASANNATPDHAASPATSPNPKSDPSGNPSSALRPDPPASPSPQPDAQTDANVSKDYTETAFDIGLEMVWIPGGSFMMGSPESETGRGSNEPLHRAEVDGFWMGKFELTQGQWEKLMKLNPSAKRGNNRLPVDSMTRDEADAFCRKLAEKAGLNYALPTETQWEYACRAGSTGIYSFGDSITAAGDYAWFGQNSAEQPHEVGQLKPNAWGLFDMHGNVWEWCRDWYADDAYATNPAKNPKGPASGEMRILRGGSWSNKPTFIRSAIRGRSVPSGGGMNVGFRVARNP